MGQPPKPNISALGVRERILLFCVGTDWQRADVTGQIVTALAVKGVLVRDGADRLLTDDGCYAAGAVARLMRLTPERRRATKVLANSRHGLNEELFICGHDYKRPMRIGLARRTRNSRGRGDED